MLPFITGGAVGSQIFNNALALWQNKQQRTYEKSMADYAYSKDLEMWNRTNDYNSPKNQMQRFEDAGLNKNLIYSQGQPGLAQASMPKYQDVKGTFGVPGLNANSFANVINAYQDYEIKNKQKTQIEEMTKNIVAERKIKFWRAANEEGAFKYKYPLSDWLISTDMDSPMGIMGPQQIGDKTMSEYDLENRSLRNRGLLLTNDILLNKKGITGSLKDWYDLKLSTFKNTNINIDKDGIIERQIADIFGEAINAFTEWSKRNIHKLITK